MEVAACLLLSTMLTSQQLPPRAAVMRNCLPPRIWAWIRGGAITQSALVMEEIEVQSQAFVLQVQPWRHLNSDYVICQVMPQCCPSLICSGFKPSRCPDSWQWHYYSVAYACRPHLSREAVPVDCGAHKEEGLTGSLWEDTVPKDHSGIN